MPSACLGKPMSDADLEAKFRAFAGGILIQTETDELIRLCWNIAKMKDAHQTLASGDYSAPTQCHRNQGV